MALEDFERELVQSKEAERQHARHHKRKRESSRSPSRRERDEHHSSRHRHRHDHFSRHHHDHRSDDEERRRSRHSQKKSRHHRGEEGHSSHRRRREGTDKETSPLRKSVAREDGSSEREFTIDDAAAAPPAEQNVDAREEPRLKRDSWMETPSSLDIDYVQKQRRPKTPPAAFINAKTGETQTRSHENEINDRQQEVGQGLRGEDEDEEEEQREGRKPSLPVQHKVSYTFGDKGASWRMKKLQNTYREAKETGKNLDDIALDRYGDLRSFDDAREEELELDRRERYGNEYVGNEKPNGDLYQERKLDHGMRSPPQRSQHPNQVSDDESSKGQGKPFPEGPSPATAIPLDQTALNKLRAQMMRAKMTNASNAAQLEAEYEQAASAAAANTKQPDLVVLNKMESRMLTGGRAGEVKTIDNKRGRERGLVEENEDMSIEDMVRQERRSKGQFSGQASADRIAKDAKFDNDNDYMDDNAARLARSAPKSDVNLRNTAIADFQRMKRVLDTCPLCHHEDTNTPPQAPLVSLGTRTFLTLPTSPEITPYGRCATVVPVQHRLNLLECDEDEWEELRNFMKSLTRFYWNASPRRAVVFYENAAHAGRKRHASLEAVPLPVHLGETAPAYFREAMLSADEEWTQHRKVIDTLAKAREGGMGKIAFRRSMVSELPYFHVWFALDGGLGHVVEDERRWPKGDLFAREILGGMLDVGPEVVKKQGRWRRGDGEMERRVKEFRKGWDKFDWTQVLMGQT